MKDNNQRGGINRMGMGEYMKYAGDLLYGLGDRVMRETPANWTYVKFFKAW